MDPVAAKLDEFVGFLLEYTRKINVLSRNVTRASLLVLIEESLRAGQHVTGNPVIDAGSGNGLLGIPFAIRFPERSVILVESTLKKSRFLLEACRLLGLGNARVESRSIQEFMHHFDQPGAAIVARGFPDNELLAGYILRNRVAELVLITAPEKAKMMGRGLEKFRRTDYNVPSRDNLVISVLENVSRETTNEV